jgi:predicted RNA binding protein YcfA (HicA-like mRNA interferase family)
LVSHHIFTHRYNPYTIPIPHPKKDLPLETVKRVKSRSSFLADAAMEKLVRY